MIRNVLTLIVVFLSTIQCNKNILVHPQRQSVTLNSTIILQCRVPEIKNIKVQWVKNGFGLGDTKADIRQYGQSGNIFRYDLPRDIERGQYDLQITNVNLDDEGEYYCQTSMNNQAITSQRASVQVYVASRSPKIIQITNEGTGEECERLEGSNIIVNNGQMMVLRCEASGGRPGAKLFWSIGNEVIEPDANGNFNGVMIGSISIKVQKNKVQAKLRDSFSILKAKVSQLLNGKSVQCSAFNKGYEKFSLRPAMAKIEIHVAPTVTMDIIPRRIDNEFVENEWITISCLASGRPDQFTWKWFLNEKLLENENRNSYKIQTGRTTNKSVVKCVAFNNREGFAQQTINVKFGPQFNDHSSSVYPSSIGEDVKMTCQADSNPGASIFWQRESSNDILSHGPILYRRNVQELDFGFYVCTATAENFTPIFRKIYLAKKSQPFVSENPDRSAALGKPIQIKCVIQSIPLPKSNEIIWFFRGRKLMESTKYSIFEENFLGGTTSNLQINNVESNDLGQYNCSVSTESGGHWRTMTLSNTSQMPLILIVGGTIFVTMVMLIIIVIICVCKRGICNNKYQKGSPVNRKEHSQIPMKNPHMEMDYQCQPNIYQWIPPTQRDPTKSSFVRYGQDIDDRSSVRNGSINQFRGIDMCSTYTSSIPGSQNGEKQLRCTDEDDIYSPANPPLICSMHITSNANGIPNRTSPCNMHPLPQPQIQHQMSLPQYNFTAFPNAPHLSNYLSGANSNFALSLYPVHSLSSDTDINGGGVGSVIPSTMSLIHSNDANHMADVRSVLPSSFIRQGSMNSHFMNSYLSPGLKPKQNMYNISVSTINENNTFRSSTLDRHGHVAGYTHHDQTTNI